MEHYLKEVAPATIPKFGTKKGKLARIDTKECPRCKRERVYQKAYIKDYQQTMKFKYGHSKSMSRYRLKLKRLGVKRLSDFEEK